MSDKQNKQEFIVTARKWRPLQFKDVVGQSHITLTLQNSIRLKRTHHAYLFSGPRGVGKTTTARILARALNCLSPVDNEPCNECISCTSILDGRSLDVIEIDGASNNSVEDVRKLRENAKYPPSGGNFKMYIIDEVHMLSNSAFNALLKTLEEPPPHLMFVFATTEPHKVPATILSRCQRFEFRRMEIDDTVSQLKFIAEKEGITIDEESLITIAKKADGSMRDGQSIFDQVRAFCGDNIVYSEMADALHLIDQDFYFRITDAIIESNSKEMFSLTKEVIGKGYDLQECLGGLLEHMRNVLVVKMTGNTADLESSKAYTEKYINTADAFTAEDLLRYMNLINHTEQGMRFAAQPRIKFEFTLVQLASMDKAVLISELLQEIRALKHAGGTYANASDTADTVQKKNIAKQQTSVSKPTEKQSPVETINISAGNIAESWTQFTGKYRKKDSSYRLLKDETLVALKFLDKEIIITVQSNFVADQIKKSKQALEEHLSEFYSERINLKIIVDEAAAKPLSKESETKTSPVVTDSKTNSPENDINEEMSPLEQNIVSIFEAKRIPDIN